ncbi:aldehyde dehydrogenase family protein [Actinacidiphila acididurans]|uniref:Aldehyde dehydrogenase n=1 Tax=Actinacidiphila acididurans TaxID=2784346 RepID=A0ABS2TTB1_9ACTN|nr:aldehyde dehydrogenase family protein [Actinacidiphila acididurans]MBM9506580.1 aldehyde dehydrogenase family protein [Actinacidiphila acididurans]
MTTPFADVVDVSALPVDSLDQVDAVFAAQRAAYSPARPPTAAERVDRIERLERLLQAHYRELTATLEADFGYRSPDQILAADMYPGMAHASHVRRHLRQWMRPRRKSSGALGLLGVRSREYVEPLGVVGIMSPFNAPVSLAVDPAIDALAAGNRVIMKPSELTPRTAALFRHLVAQAFDETEVAVVTGGVEVSAHFAALPWDKFLFTGGTDTGRRILEAAAPHLTPVILELGGKCPAIVLPDADIRATAAQIAQGRLGNAGQICLSVDYALVPEDRLEEFLAAALEAAVDVYPTVQGNRDYSAMIDERAYDRILSLIDDARASGARVLQPAAHAGEELDRARRQVPLTVVVNPRQDSRVDQEEIFGPILSVYTYSALDQAIAVVNSKPKALALYVLGRDRRATETIVTSTSTGGVTVNAAALHAMSGSMGFGGVGPSGMGRYKGGRVGFDAFSNSKSVVHASRLLLRLAGENAAPPFRTERARNNLLRLARLPRHH